MERQLMRVAALIASSLFLIGCASAEKSADASGAMGERLAAETAAAIDSAVDAAVRDGFGGHVAIMRNGKIVYSRAAGFADNALKTPVRADTLYHTASMTKFFTAILTLKAVEEGLLSLDSDASALFAGTPLADRRFALRDLLDHRSGLRSTYAAEAEIDADEALQAIAAANAANVGNGEFRYSNDGYDLLAILLERTYGKTYEALFRERIAAPAGISAFSFWGEADLENPRLLGQPLTPLSDAMKKRNYGMIGSAGLLISAEDLVRFLDALDRGLIIGPDMLAELNKPRAQISIGHALYGAFLIETSLGPARSVRGAEDWGDNGYLNDYIECGFAVAVLTSRGPAEGSGKPFFRDSLILEIENSLTPDCGPSL